MTATVAPTSLSTAPRSSRAAVILFCAFLGSTLVGPATPANKIPFALMFIWMLWDQAWLRRPSAFPMQAPAAILGIFIYGFAVSLLNKVDTDLAVQLAISTVVLLLIDFVIAHRLDFDRIAVGGAFVLLICTTLFWMSIGTGLPFSAQIYQFFMDYNFSGASNREFFDGGATFTLQLGTAPWLFVGFCVVGMRLFSPERKRWDTLKLALIFIGILVSGLRGLVSITILYAAFLCIRAMAPRYRWLVVVAIALVAWVFWFAVLSGSQVFSSEEVSNSIKLGHFDSYLQQLTWWNGLFGEGLGAFYYSTGTGSMRAYTELTPIDMARYLGIPLTLVLYAALLFPRGGIWRYTRRQGGYTIAMLLFTVLSMSNPVMFNSYGLLVVLWYWSSLTPRPTAGSAS